MADEIYIAKESSVQDVNLKIGSTADTEGTKTTGTMMAKENAILGGIGKTNDAEGSAIAGSVMGKLNKLLSTNLDANFLALNSTIGTENEKPLDFFSKNVLASDGQYFTPIPSVEVSYLAGRAPSVNDFIDAGSRFIDSNNLNKDLYVVFKESEGVFRPATIDPLFSDKSTGYRYQSVSSTKVSFYNSTSLKGIMCSNVDDTVYYVGVSNGDSDNTLRIFKMNANLSSRLAVMQLDQEDTMYQFVMDEQYIYYVRVDDSGSKQHN